MGAYERALAANPNSVPAMNAISLILRTREEFHKAVEYLQMILKIEPSNGEVWGSLGMFGWLEMRLLQLCADLCLRQDIAFS
jgi:tetratricopeptide (TPR) repeat protein